MMSTRYLAPLVECARRKNHTSPADRRGMREVLLQRQFWCHLTAFVHESARAEAEQMHRERCRSSPAASMPPAPAEPQRQCRTSGQLPSATKPRARAARAPSPTNQHTSHFISQDMSGNSSSKTASISSVVPQLSASHDVQARKAAAPTKKTEKRTLALPAVKRSAPQDHASTASSSADSSASGDSVAMRPVTKRRRANTKGASIAISDAHIVPQSLGAPSPAHHTRPRCTEFVQPALSPVGPVSKDTLDAAAQEFMHFLAQRQALHQQHAWALHQQQLQQQQAVL